MAKTKVFTGHDSKHDFDMKNNLICQSKRANSPFSIKDMSLNETVSNW